MVNLKTWYNTDMRYYLFIFIGLMMIASIGTFVIQPSVAGAQTPGISITDVYFKDAPPYLPDTTYRLYVIVENTTGEDYTGPLNITFTNQNNRTFQFSDEKIITILGTSLTKDGVYVDGSFTQEGTFSLHSNLDQSGGTSTKKPLDITVVIPKTPESSATPAPAASDDVPDTNNQSPALKDTSINVLDTLIDFFTKKTNVDSDIPSSENTSNSAETDLPTSDTDNDGLPDTWELDNQTKPNKPSADRDPDHDGLTNIQEFNAHTNPQSSDTDNDGLDDKRELDNEYNPVDSTDGLADNDGDGVPNATEIRYHLDPERPTTVAFIPDSWMIYVKKWWWIIAILFALYVSWKIAQAIGSDEIISDDEDEDMIEDNSE